MEEGLSEWTCPHIRSLRWTPNLWLTTTTYAAGGKRVVGTAMTTPSIQVPCDRKTSPTDTVLVNSLTPFLALLYSENPRQQEVCVNVAVTRRVADPNFVS